MPGLRATCGRTVRQATAKCSVGLGPNCASRSPPQSQRVVRTQQAGRHHEHIPSEHRGAEVTTVDTGQIAGLLTAAQVGRAFGISALYR